MTTTLISIPEVKKDFVVDIPYERKGPVWFTQKPIVKGIELMMAKYYGQRFLYCQALTNRLQILEIMKGHK